MRKTIRSRAIELDQQLIFPEELPEGLHELKLEADAHLAIVISRAADDTAENEVLQKNFLERFANYAVNIDDKPYASSDRHMITNAFFEEYDRYFAKTRVHKVMRSELGDATRASCMSFYDAAKDHLASEGVELTHDYSLRLYDQPVRLIGLGMRSLGDKVEQALDSSYLKIIEPEERLSILKNTHLPIKQIASLALDQMIELGQESPDRPIVDGRIQMVDDIRATRQHIDISPVASARSHNGCPALAVMPEGNLLKQGSAITKMFDMTVGLIEKTRLHTLDAPIGANGNHPFSDVIRTYASGA